MGYSSLHDAVMDASVSHAMNQMSTGDVDVAATNAGYVGDTSTNVSFKCIKKNLYEKLG